MAFLDNSGDIILDAVLTDTGRQRLSRGDGTFKIVKFALGDDEIDYALYDATNPLGSAYYDLQILQTPVLEAFTNNTSTMNSKLMTITDSRKLYLPVVKLNEKKTENARNSTTSVFYATADDSSYLDLKDSSTGGVINASNPSDGGVTVRLDQGIDTSKIPPSKGLSSDLVETNYLIEIDSRLGSIVDKTGTITATESFIDDDAIANYSLTLGTDTSFVIRNTDTNPISTGSTTSPNQTIAGPRGTILEFGLGVTEDLLASNAYFIELGGSVTIGSTNFYYIDTNVRITGLTTGYRIDIPVRFLKKQ